MPKKGQPLSEAHKAKLQAAKTAYWEKVEKGELEHPKKGKKAKQQPAPLHEYQAAAPLPESDPAELIAAHADLFAAHQQTVEQTILALATGIKVALPVKKTKLLRGESEYEVETAEGKTLFVYCQPPNPGMLRLIAEQTRGKAAAREAAAGAATIIIKCAVPGHDEVIDQYLTALPPEKLKAYKD